MVFTLGIHIGHHSSCALVRDGVLLSAIQLERVSRQKHHVTHQLNNDLPIESMLNNEGLSIENIDLIVSSFAAAAPGGIGLKHHLVSNDFSLFDPGDKRHIVISHHLAHAYSSFESSGFLKGAVLVCDYAGSSTVDGKDYAKPFSVWYNELTEHRKPIKTKTEWLSIYKASCGKPYELLERRFCTAHPRQSVFVHHVTGLYENVADYIFEGDQAYGQLMALAAYGSNLIGTGSDPGPMIDCINGELSLLNNWQHHLPPFPDDNVKAVVAYRCQEATERILTQYAQQTRFLTKEQALCLSGGVFLNILANTKIWQSQPEEPLFIPSAPHDAGVAVGCAFFGWRQLQVDTPPRKISSDALGPRYERHEIETELQAFSHLLDVEEIDIEKIADMLCQGHILARWSGRSEFGPRALGRRSLLGDPRKASAKDRLNKIKGRQSWRPVAPIVTQEAISKFFDGPTYSPWMNLSHIIRPQYREELAALKHPDNTTRAQTLERRQDPDLYRILTSFEEKSGFPILINTSLNRGGEPIAERLCDAINIYLAKSDIDFLIIDGLLVKRKSALEEMSELYQLHPKTILTKQYLDGEEIFRMIYDTTVWTISHKLSSFLQGMGRQPVPLKKTLATHNLDEEDLNQFFEIMNLGAVQQHAKN